MLVTCSTGDEDSDWIFGHFREICGLRKEEDDDNEVKKMRSDKWIA